MILEFEFLGSEEIIAIESSAITSMAMAKGAIPLKEPQPGEALRLQHGSQDMKIVSGTAITIAGSSLQERVAVKGEYEENLARWRDAVMSERCRN